MRRLARFACFAALVQAAACNSILGNEERTLDDGLQTFDGGGKVRDAGADTGDLNRIDNLLDAGRDSSGSTDGSVADADAGPRQPDPSCVKTSGMVTPNAVRRVEIDTSPTPVVTATTFTASFSIFGDNALSNVHLDMCTPDGLRADVGGGTNFLGGGGAVTRHWQTKAVTALPIGRVQAQVYSEDPPVLRYFTTLDLR